MFNQFIKFQNSRNNNDPSDIILLYMPKFYNFDTKCKRIYVKLHTQCYCIYENWIKNSKLIIIIE